MPRAVIAAVGALIAIVLVRIRQRQRLPARAIIINPGHSTVIARDGAVRSAQSAELALDRADLERLWHPTNLENLARTYWRFLSRATLGLIRVVYGANERSVVFLAQPFRLLRFDAPEYVLEPDHGQVKWRIRDGLLVAKSGRGCGFLALDVRLSHELAADGCAKVRIEVEVSNFYPAIAAGFSTPVYEATQSAIHVLVTHSFLRSLATLELAESKVGRLAAVSALPAGPISRNGGSAVANAGERPELGAIVPSEDPPDGS